MKQFEANNENVSIKNSPTDTRLIMGYKGESGERYHVDIPVFLEDMVFIRNCFDTIIKQETLEGDMLIPMINTAINNAMVKMECKIIPK